MKIGVFDSGLGGLLVMRSLTKKLPEYDYVYLGDTERVPYGNRSQKTVLQFLEQAIDFLFKHDCALIIVACNTASAEALRKIQQQYLPKHYPNRRVLGVIIPTAEAALEVRGAETPPRRIGVLATQGTVHSNAYGRELKKITGTIKIFQQAAPLLVPLIEHDGKKWIKPILNSYLEPLMQKRVDTIILGCTHYPLIKKEVKKIARTRIVSQDEIIPKKLKNYLKRHPEIDKKLSRRKKRELLVTDITPSYRKLARTWFGPRAELKEVIIDR